MNLRALIAWGFKTLAILDHPGPEVLQYGTKERLEEKLGWLRQFREALQGWSEMEQTIDVSRGFRAHAGSVPRGGEDLRKRLAQLPVGPIGAELGDDLSKFVAGQASPLRRGERLPGSSEVIESCFGKFKTLERDQAKEDSPACSWHWPRASPSELKRSSTKLSKPSKPETSSPGSRPSWAPPWDPNAA